MKRVHLAVLTLAAVAAGCSSSSKSSTGPGLTGTVVGTVTSSLGGGLAHVAVILTPAGAAALAADTTNASGGYSIANVPDGGGTIGLSMLPANCSSPNPTPYGGVTTGGMVTVNIPVTCVPQTGNLTVTVAAPVGITPRVMVSGPGGYMRALNATTTLTGLVVGSYAVTAADTSVTISDTIVNTILGTPVISGSPATVIAGGTASASVSYGAGGTGALWVVETYNFGGFLAGFPVSGLRASGAVTPAKLQGPNISYSIAFDASGNAWVGQEGSVDEYSAAQLAISGDQTPITTIIDSAIVQPESMAFDKSGNLWLSDMRSNTVMEFTAAQLTTGGTKTPAVTISSDAILVPNGLAFDANGTLWVANSYVVLGFTASQLATSGKPTPISITVEPASLAQYVTSVAFDGGGDMWVETAFMVVEYTPSQLTASGSPTPNRTVTLPGGGFSSSLEGMAFDNSGNLWLTDIATPRLVELSPAQLATGGTQTPQVVIPSPSAAYALAFDPPSPSLPLYGARIISGHRAPTTVHSVRRR
ncbi:MAG TPA: hypothetical protein VFA43_00380 [Gemmatimonadaceae bacterium]|nr:hypothetical protein [Gemmatimonadaceae bacterium]